MHQIIRSYFDAKYEPIAKEIYHDLRNLISWATPGPLTSRDFSRVSVYRLGAHCRRSGQINAGNKWPRWGFPVLRPDFPWAPPFSPKSYDLFVALVLALVGLFHLCFFPYPRFDCSRCPHIKAQDEQIVNESLLILLNTVATKIRGVNLQWTSHRSRSSLPWWALIS